MNKSYLVIFVLVVCFFTTHVFAKPFILAAMYAADNRLSHANYVVAQLVNEAQRKGLDVKLVNLINEDNSYATALVLAKKAIDLNVDAVIGGGDSSEQAVIVSKILNDAKIPTLMSTASLMEIYKNKPYIFSIFPTSLEISDAICKQMMSIVPKAKKILIVRDLSMPFAVYNAAYINNFLKNKFPNIAVYYFDVINGHEYQQYLAEQLLRIKPDILYIATHNAQVSVLLTELTGQTKEPFSLHVFVPTLMISDEARYFKLLLAQYPNIKCHVFSVWSRKLAEPYAMEYKAIISKKYEIHDQYVLTDDLRTVFAFDSAKFMLQVIASNPEARGMNLIKAAKETTFYGITGKVQFDNSGLPVRNYNEMGFVD